MFFVFFGFSCVMLYAWGEPEQVPQQQCRNKCLKTNVICYFSGGHGCRDIYQQCEDSCQPDGEEGGISEGDGIAPEEEILQLEKRKNALFALHESDAAF
ncbi:MAG: hypothetical protein ACPG7U_02495 [Holosporaceae bacterium]